MVAKANNIISLSVLQNFFGFFDWSSTVLAMYDINLLVNLQAIWQKNVCFRLKFEHSVYYFFIFRDDNCPADR